MTITSDDVSSLNARLAGGGGTSELKKKKIQGQREKEIKTSRESRGRKIHQDCWIKNNLKYNLLLALV